MLYRLICPVLKFLKRVPYLLPVSLAVVIFLAFGPIIIARLYQDADRDLDRGAIAIKDGAYGESYAKPRYLDQGWSPANSLWFYNTSQGSGLMPYDFFLVLKQANSDEPIRSSKNIDRFRYLPQGKTFFNPDGLPVGFVKETYKGKDYVGFTCAACHTGQVNYKGQALRIDGGPAMADMVEFLTELRKAMTAAQDGEKNKNFVADVLKLKNDYSSAKEVTDDLKKWTDVVALYNTVNHSNVDYGHARLDAFGRIYNRVLQHAITRDQVAAQLALVVAPRGDNPQARLLTADQIKLVVAGTGARVVLVDEDFALIVERLFSKAPGYPGLSLKDFLYVRDKIFNAPNAPVSYPFLWDIAHSDYVQWNGLASNAGLGPLGRNTGEVIGVFGILDWGTDNSIWGRIKARFQKFSLSAILSGQSDKKEIIQFNSSINLFNLQRLEKQLTSLTSPEWPFCRNDKGEYYLPPPLPGGENDPIAPSAEKYCSGSDKRFVDARLKRGELIYIDRCQACHTVVDRTAWDRVVVSNILALRKAGTDVAMASNSVNYKGQSGNFKDTYQKVGGVGDMVVAEEAPVVQILTAATTGVVATPDHNKWFIQRWVEYIYTLLASIGDNTIKNSIKVGNYDPDTTATPYASLLSYRARSLNGIWATAPYLHNGSVPTLDDLLRPPEERPKSFKVGVREFDPEKIGFVDGGKEFNTIQRGNMNTGHNYGARLTDEQRKDLLEYLRSL